MIMQNCVLDPQDQRKTSSMEDSTATTIEFLRARLLSERSISRNARHRADELARKVMELEIQLSTATLQRKMAEKATAHVLAILENQGMSDVSEEFDSGSDLEMSYEFGISNDSTKWGERSMSSKGRRHGSDELYDSDVDSSPVFGRSLSWKGHLDSPCSPEKYNTSNLSRQSSFSSISSSPNHCLAKSCRQMRHRQTRSVVEESRDELAKVNCQENVVSPSEGFPNCSDGGSNILRIEYKIQEEDESEVKLANKNNHLDEYRREDMEKALAHKAQLTVRYGAMETTQREWEEKFRENGSTTPDSCDMGNHLDNTEERDENKAQTPFSARAFTLNAQEDKSEARGVCLFEQMFKAEVRDDMPNSYNDTGGYNNQKSTIYSTCGLLGKENSHSLLKWNQNESSENCHCQLSDRHHEGLHGHVYPASKPTDSFSTDVYRLEQNDASRNKKDLYPLVSHEKSHEFSSVLESLKQARLSLQQELSRLPLVKGGYSGKPIKPSGSVSYSDNRFQSFDIGCSGLFRVPTDFFDEATSRFNIHASTGNLYLDRGISRTYGGQVCSNPYSSTMLSFSSDDQYLATRFLESGSRFDPKSPPFDPFSQGGLLSSGKCLYPTFPIYPSCENGTRQMSFGDVLSRPYSSGTFGVPLVYHFSFHGDHLRSNMYV